MAIIVVNCLSSLDKTFSSSYYATKSINFHHYEQRSWMENNVLTLFSVANNVIVLLRIMKQTYAIKMSRWCMFI